MPSRKVYVKVISQTDEQGNIMPITIIWENDKKYNIDKILDIRRAYAKKVGGIGIRYSIVINGKQTYLFKDGDKWYVESNES